MRASAEDGCICPTHVKDEVPEILDLVCDNFLQRFDREDLGGASQQRSIRSEKLMEIAYREMRLYMEQRFKSHEVAELAMKIGTDNKKLFQQVSHASKASAV